MKHFPYQFFILLTTITIAFFSCEDEAVPLTPPTGEEDEETVFNWSETADSMQESTYNLYIRSDGTFNYNPGGDYAQYWPNAHGLHILVDAYLRTGDGAYLSKMENLVNGIQNNNGGTYSNVFNDDMLWLANASMRAFDATDDDQYLALAEYLWDDVLLSYSEVFGGGITWKKDTPFSKNAVSNGPTIVLATRLYSATQDEQYLNWAKDLYNWQKATLVDPQTGLVWDNIHLENNEEVIQKNWIFTYNAGTWIGAGLRLFQITGERAYLDDALQTANAAMTRSELNTEGILKNEGQGDGGLFKGIFIRYFTELIQEETLDDSERQDLVDFLHFNATTLYEEGLRRPDMLVGPDWSNAPGEETDFTTQLSGIMLVEAAALLQEEGFFD